MASRNFYKEDIGQVIMLYSFGVLFANIYSSRVVDKIKKTRPILFLGNIGSGFGLIMIGFVSLYPVIFQNVLILPILLLVLGTFILGLSHGFINAPIITHITESKSAGIVGKNSIISIHRSLERIGQLFGPIIITSLLFIKDFKINVYLLIGSILIIFGLLFLFHLKEKNHHY